MLKSQSIFRVLQALISTFLLLGLLGACKYNSRIPSSSSPEAPPEVFNFAKFVADYKLTPDSAEIGDLASGESHTLPSDKLVQSGKKELKYAWSFHSSASADVQAAVKLEGNKLSWKTDTEASIDVPLLVTFDFDGKQKTKKLSFKLKRKSGGTPPPPPPSFDFDKFVADYKLTPDNAVVDNSASGKSHTLPLGMFVQPGNKQLKYAWSFHSSASADVQAAVKLEGNKLSWKTDTEASIDVPLLVTFDFDGKQKTKKLSFKLKRKSGGTPPPPSFDFDKFVADYVLSETEATLKAPANSKADYFKLTKKVVISGETVKLSWSVTDANVNTKDLGSKFGFGWAVDTLSEYSFKLKVKFTHNGVEKGPREFGFKLKRKSGGTPPPQNSGNGGTPPPPPPSFDFDKFVADYKLTPDNAVVDNSASGKSHTLPLGMFVQPGNKQLKCAWSFHSSASADVQAAVKLEGNKLSWKTDTEALIDVPLLVTFDFDGKQKTKKLSFKLKRKSGGAPPPGGQSGSGGTPAPKKRAGKPGSKKNSADEHLEKVILNAFEKNEKGKRLSEKVKLQIQKEFKDKDENIRKTAYDKFVDKLMKLNSLGLGSDKEPKVEPKKYKKTLLKYAKKELKLHKAKDPSATLRKAAKGRIGTLFRLNYFIEALQKYSIP